MDGYVWDTSGAKHMCTDVGHNQCASVAHIQITWNVVCLHVCVCECMRAHARAHVCVCMNSSGPILINYMHAQD